MTTPQLSMATTEKIGRLYQLPGGGFEQLLMANGKLHHSRAGKGLNDGTLFPSITNVIGAMNKSLEGWHIFMAKTALEQGYSNSEALNAANVYRDFCGERGTRVHAAIEEFFELELENEYLLYGSEEYKKMESYEKLLENNNLPIPHANPYGKEKFSHDVFYFEAFLRFLEDFRPKVLAQEATCYGRTPEGYTFAGTTDLLAYFGGQLFAVDWKTSRKLSTSTAMQLSAVQNSKKYTKDFENLLETPTIFGGLGVQLNPDGTYICYETNNFKGWEDFCAARILWEHYVFGNSQRNGEEIITEITPQRFL